MSNKFVNFISDDHLLECIEYLFKSYEKTKKEMNLKSFYKNKVDGIKFNFDILFNGISEAELITAEINRKADKAINNAIGTFHEKLIGGINGFQNLKIGNGYDVKNDNNTIFAEVKNKHNTMNSSSSSKTFQNLKSYVDKYPNSKAYLVQVIAKKSTNETWNIEGNTDKRIRLISMDRFYELATGQEHAFYELCTALPKATKHFLTEKSITPKPEKNKVYDKLVEKSQKNRVDIITQILKDNLDTYKGFSNN